MRKQQSPASWLLISLAAASTVAAVHCGAASTTATSATASTSDALQQSSNSTDAVEVAGLMMGPDAFAPDAVEAFRCDASPVVTNVTVCGRSLPATVEIAWTSCEVPEGNGVCAPGPDGMARPPSPDGGSPPLPPDGGILRPPPGACGADGGTCMAGGPPPGPSTGTVDITNTYSTPDGCDAGIEEEQTATFDVTRTLPNGDTSTDKGTATSTEDLTAGAPPQSKSTTITVTRTETDSSGAVVGSVQLMGSRTETFSGANPPTRTVTGSLSAVFSDGTTGTVTLTSVVYPPMSQCRWPTSGTLIESDSDGTTHTLTYGPTCGSATLDGTAIQLDDPGPGPGPGMGHGSMPGARG